MLTPEQERQIETVRSYYDALARVYPEKSAAELIAMAQHHKDREDYVQRMLADDEMTAIIDAAYRALDLIATEDTFTPNHRFAREDGARINPDDVYNGSVEWVNAKREDNHWGHESDYSLAKFNGFGALSYAYQSAGATWDMIEQLRDTFSKTPAGESSWEWARLELHRLIGECEEYLNEEYCRLEEEFDKENDSAESAQKDVSND